MILEALLGQRSIENPSVPISQLTPEHEFWNTLTGGGVSDSGVRVNRNVGLSYAAVWRAINLISRDVAKLPLLVYARLDAGGKERAMKHPAYRLLRRKPNQYMKAFDFKQTLMGHALLNGNGYGYIFRAGDGAPLEVLPLSPDVTWPVREDGRLWYVTTIDPGDGQVSETRKLLPENVLHIKGLGFDGLVGYDVLSYAKETIGLGIGLRRYGARFFKNNAASGVLFECPGKMSETAEENFLKSWDTIHSGLDNAHKTAILQQGITAKIMTVDARRAQLKEMREFELRDVANFLGVPPHKVGDTTRTAYASLEQENQAYLDEALDGWLCQWEEECTDKLLAEKEKAEDSHFCEFVREALVRVDFATRVEGTVKQVNNGLMCPDEGRALQNMGPLPDGEGKKFRIPKNIKIIGDEDEEEDDGGDNGVPPPPPPPPPPPQDEDDEESERKRQARVAVAHDALLLDALRRMHTRVATQARKAAKRPGEFIQWLESGLEGNSRAGCNETLAPVLAVCTSVGVAVDARGVLDRYFGGVREALLTAAECQADELVGRVDAWARETAHSLPRALADEIMGAGAGDAV